MISWLTSLMMIVLPIFRKFCKCALASSWTFPLNWVTCTILMRLGLSSNSRLFVSNARPVWIFSTVGAENSRRVFVAIALEIGDKLLLGLIQFWWWRVEWIRNNPANTLYKIQTQKNNRGEPAKVEVPCYDFSFSKYLFMQFFSKVYSFPGNGARNACWHF
jgi:hypothetical protein